MINRAAWITITLLSQLASIARAQEGPPSVRNADAPIPANSALILDTPSGAPDVQVVNSAGELIHGDMTDIANSGSRYYAWIPRRELPPGEYEVRFVWAQGDPSTVQVTITEAEVTELLTLESAPTATRETVDDGDACCSTPLFQTVPSSCFAVHQTAWMKLQPGLSAHDDLAVSDYVYRLLVPEGSPEGGADVPFANLYDLTHAVFHDAGELYCVELQALNIKNGRLAIYEDLSICAEGEEGPIGTYEVEVPDSALSMDQCPVPPDEYSEQWCAQNEDACTPDAQAECQLHAFVCDDGPVPDVWRGSDTATAGMSGEVDDGTDSSGSGCSCRVTKSRTAGRSYLLGVPLGVLVALRARGRTRRRDRHYAH